ncbi:hypothetical protein [Niabella hibiscisoli]|uniref:hypothetical protein n=1 Tax=Niabella hibiscisoli TaxID=1825928 RepID=UPI001F0FDFCD|nr:hypothetical protein [Niabella hibiscisoli]MCH5717462.1 hypothetical protein [Niabella hibiscisoli]
MVDTDRSNGIDRPVRIFSIRSLFISGTKSRAVFTVAYWAFSAIALVLLIFVLPYFQASEQHKALRSILFVLVFALFLGKLIGALFFFIDDLRRAVQWIAGKIFSPNNEISEIAGTTGDRISRSSFLTWLHYFRRHYVCLVYLWVKQ